MMIALGKPRERPSRQVLDDFRNPRLESTLTNRSRIECSLTSTSAQQHLWHSLISMPMERAEVSRVFGLESSVRTSTPRKFYFCLPHPLTASQRSTTRSYNSTLSLQRYSLPSSITTMAKDRSVNFLSSPVLRTGN